MLFESTKTEAGKVTSWRSISSGCRAIRRPSTTWRREPSGHGAFAASGELQGQGPGSAVLTDPIDEFVTIRGRVQGQEAQGVDKVGIDQANISDEKKTQFQPLLDYFKEKVADIGDAR